MTPPSKSQGRKFRWRRWIAGSALALLLLHVPLLRFVGRCFTAAPPPEGPFDAVVILSGDHRIHRVAQLDAADRINQIWTVESPANYLVREGILADRMSAEVDELVAVGVAPERIEPIGDLPARELSDVARSIQRRLRKSPELQVLVVCASLQGRHVRYVLDAVLTPEQAGQVSILGLPYDEFDAENWWQSRAGLKQIFTQACEMGFTLVTGTAPSTAGDEIDPNAIEADLQDRFGSSACYEF